MPTLAKNQARQVSRIGETPAEARARMRAAEGPSGISEPKGEEVKGPLQPQHMAEIRAAEEGFSGGPAVDGTVEEAERTEHISPSAAAEVVRRLSQEKLQLQTERDSALNLVEQYRAQFGDLD